MLIVAPPSASRDRVHANLMNKYNPHARFSGDMFIALWEAALHYEIDPVGVIAQSYKETAGGHYTGQVKPEFYNTCGLKVRHLGIHPEVTGDKPLAHQMFPNWVVGAEAHVQHLRAYVNWPVHELIVDPRYELVIGNKNLVHWSELGGGWAPSPSYGVEIEAIMRALQA